tara:strand:+ start:1678 stop:2886 length:1209 start_codon:yes stop_codon:yes gene_type:complete
LSAIANQLSNFVDQGTLSGIVTLTWRAGEVVGSNALGMADIGHGRPMTADTIFQIASMTKPITSVAAMMLVEEGALRLDDPIAQWVPELANPNVLRDPNGDIADCVQAHRHITIEDLLTHRSGLGYSFFTGGPISKAYAELGNPLWNAGDPDIWLAGLGGLPLVYQPGERMFYGVSTDVLGFLIARVEGKPFRQVLQDRIFGPLGMTDTDFWFPADKRERIATLYQFDETTDHLVARPSLAPDEPPSFCSGGAGLFSTANDYLLFARMLLNKGKLDGVRILREETVDQMLINRLTPEQRAIPFISNPTWEGMGFGLGLGIVDIPEKNLLGCGRTGSFTWPGAYGTWWQADPVEDLIMIYMIQHFIDLSPEMGAAIATGRGLHGRGALPIFQKMTYDQLDEVH